MDLQGGKFKPNQMCYRCFYGYNEHKCEEVVLCQQSCIRVPSSIEQIMHAAAFHRQRVPSTSSLFRECKKKMQCFRQIPDFLGVSTLLKVSIWNVSCICCLFFTFVFVELLVCVCRIAEIWTSLKFHEFLFFFW